MSVMSALVLSVFVGLSAAWTHSRNVVDLLHSFQEMVLLLVRKILLPVLPFFVAANFCVLSYEGALTRQLPVFLSVIALVIVCHYIWLAFLYLAASFYTRRNGWKVLKHYGPAYLTALGTMSSAATLGVALECATQTRMLRKETIDITIPLFANIHLCGSILTEVFFCLDCFAIALWNPAGYRYYDPVCCIARILCDRCSRSARRYCSGLARTDCGGVGLR